VAESDFAQEFSCGSDVVCGEGLQNRDNIGFYWPAFSNSQAVIDILRPHKKYARPDKPAFFQKLTSEKTSSGYGAIHLSGFIEREIIVSVEIPYIGLEYYIRDTGKFTEYRREFFYRFLDIAAVLYHNGER